ncbi:MAG: hypothetical protein QUV06_01520 [Cyanobium sp. CZS 48M]|nr:hypothetical protein [Cyanobium sp. CZS48M]
MIQAKDSVAVEETLAFTHPHQPTQGGGGMDPLRQGSFIPQHKGAIVEEHQRKVIGICAAALIVRFHRMIPVRLLILGNKSDGISLGRVREIELKHYARLIDNLSFGNAPT